MRTMKSVAHDWLRALDTYANETYGRSLTSAVVEGACVSCGRNAQPFPSAEAEAAYVRVGLCMHCQDVQHSTPSQIVPFAHVGAVNAERLRPRSPWVSR